MEDKLREECGIFGMFTRNQHEIENHIYYGLYALQHRGQESAGMAISDGENIRHHRGMGLVAEAFTQDDLKRLKGGTLGIGHVRYSTTGASEIENAQPIVMKYHQGVLALAHNGNLINVEDLRGRLAEDGTLFQTTLDTEVIANLISRYAKDRELGEAVAQAMNDIQGSYALVIMDKNRLIGVRDPHGMRPLALGRLQDSYVLASESCAFDAIGADFIRDVKPGEIVMIDRDGLHSYQTPVPLCSSLCIFEFVYFARTDSVIDGISVYLSRRRAGRQLAKEHPADADLVIGVPDSGITAALGYAEESGIPFGEGLIKNRYVGRTFIQPQQHLRDQGVLVKLNALRHIVKGKRIVMIDDSIVRGTTSQKIVTMLRTAGAREVHMRISSPPVAYSCHFGIDIPYRKQLLASDHTVEEMGAHIGVDSLGFLSKEGLVKTVEGSGCGFCTGCFDGCYSMEVEKDRAKYLFDSPDRSGDDK